MRQIKIHKIITERARTVDVQNQFALATNRTTCFDIGGQIEHKQIKQTKNKIIKLNR